MSRSASLFRRLSMALVFVFLYAPILVLIVFSFNDCQAATLGMGRALPWTGIGSCFRDRPDPGRVLHHALAVSVLATVIATVAGTFAAIGFYNMRRRWRGPLMTVNNIPMINADIVTGVTMCLFFVAAFSACGDRLADWINASLGASDLPTKLYLGFGTLLIAHITFNIPYVILSVRAQAAADGQATWWTRPRTWAAPGCRLSGRWCCLRSSRASSPALLIAFTMTRGRLCHQLLHRRLHRLHPGHAHLRHDQKAGQPGDQRHVHPAVRHGAGAAGHRQHPGGTARRSAAAGSSDALIPAALRP